LKIRQGFLSPICFALLVFNFLFYCTLYSNNDPSKESNIRVEKVQEKLEEFKLLFEASLLDSAYQLGEQIISEAKMYGLSDMQVQAQYQQARLYNRQNHFKKSDSLLYASLSYDLDDDMSFDIWLLIYNNAMRMGEFDSGKKALAEAKQFIRDSSGVNMVRYRYSLADYYSMALQDHNEVLNLLLLAKKEAPPDTDYKILFNINYQLGALYAGIAVYDQAIKVGEENEALAVKHQNHYLQLFGIFTQLSAYEELNNHDKIRSLVQRAEKVRKEHGVSTAFDYLYFLQGNSYLQQGKLDSAFYYFDLGEKIGVERNSKLELSRNYLGKSQVYYERGEYSLAMEYAEKANDIKPSKVRGLDEMFWRISATNGDYRSAYNGAIKSLEEVNEEIDSDDKYEIISKLLNDKMSIEKEQQRLQNKEKERKDELFLMQILGVALILFLIFIAVIQINNRTKLEKLNESLTKRNEALKNFSYISSHDLKEPVRNIISFSELLEQSLEESTDKTKELEFASIIKNSSKTLLEIVRSLKIFSETAFDEEIQLEVFAVDEVFDDISRNMQQLISSKNALVSFFNPERIELMNFSRPMLYLLLQNLIQNALKYNDSEQPKVQVSISTKLANYIFKVTDNGTGIESGKLEYIFKPFKTLQSKSLSQSSGLGLSICKNILDRFDGKIWVESIVGQGSNFYFTIPKTLKNA